MSNKSKNVEKDTEGDKMLIGERLRQRRRRRHLTQEQAANLYSGLRPDKPITRRSIISWEADRSKPDVDDLEILCKVYRCTIPQLMDYDFTPLELHYLTYQGLTDDEKRLYDILIKEFDGDFEELVHANGMYASLKPRYRRKVIKVLLAEYQYCKMTGQLRIKFPVSEGIIKKAYERLLKKVDSEKD